MVFDPQGIFVRYGGDAGPLATATKVAQASLGKLGLSLKNVSSIGKAAGIGIAAVGLAMVPVIKEAARFQTEMRELQKLLGRGLGEELAEQLARLSTEIPVTRRELIGIAAAATRLGVRGRANILEFTEVMAEIGIATDLSAEQASESFARIAAATNTPISRIRDMGNVANELSNTMATSFSEIVRGAGELAGVLSPLGVTVDAIFAVSAALNEVNISVSKGARRLRSFFAQAIDINKVDKFARALNMTAEEYFKFVTDDPVNALIEFIRVAKAGGEEASLLQAALDQAGRQGFNLMAQNADGLIESLETAQEHMSDSNSLADEAALFYDSAAQKLQLFKQRMDELQRRLGVELLPTIEALITASSNLLQIWNDLFNIELREFMNKKAAEETISLLKKQENAFDSLMRSFFAQVPLIGQLLGQEFSRTEKIIEAIADSFREVGVAGRNLFGKAIREDLEKFSQGLISQEEFFEKLRQTVESVNAQLGTFQLLEQQEIAARKLPGEEDGEKAGKEFLAGINKALLQGKLKEVLGVDVVLEELGEEGAQRMMDVLVETVRANEGDLQAQLLLALLQNVDTMIPVWEQFRKEADKAREARNKILTEAMNLSQSLEEERIQLVFGNEAWERRQVLLSGMPLLWKLNIIAQKQVNREIKEFFENLKEAGAEHRKFRQEIQKRIDDANFLTLESRFRLVRRVADDMADAFFDVFEAIGDGSKDAGDAVVAMIKRIAREILEARLSAFFLNLFSGFAIGGAGGTQSPALIPVGGGGAFGSGFVIPTRATGGDVRANMPHLIGEEGPEVFVPKRSGSVIPNDMLGQPIVVQNTFNIRALDGESVKQILEKEKVFLTSKVVNEIQRSEVLKKGLR